MLGMLRIYIGPLGIEFDRDYGLLKKTGWSVCWRGSVYSELEPWLIVALWKAAALKIRCLADT